MMRRPLAVGSQVRLTPGGPVWTVHRVNECAAYLRRGEPRQVTVTDKATGEARTFTATATETLAVSPYAFVEVA